MILTKMITIDYLDRQEEQGWKTQNVSLQLRLNFVNGQTDVGKMCTEFRISSNVVLHKDAKRRSEQFAFVPRKHVVVVNFLQFIFQSAIGVLKFVLNQHKGF